MSVHSNTFSPVSWPLLLVIPTFVWIAFAFFRSRKFIDDSGRRRGGLSSEVEKQRMINAASLSESGRKLGGLNLTLWLSAIAIAVTVSVYNILQKK